MPLNATPIPDLIIMSISLAPPRGRKKAKRQRAHLVEASESDSSSTETAEDDNDDRSTARSRNWYGHEGQPQMPSQSTARANVGFIQQAEVVEYYADEHGGPAWSVEQSWMIHELLR